jgi:DNA-damage-inducible protein D
MPNELTPLNQQTSFEDLRRLNQHGAEYWSARDLQSLLGYSQWRRFEEAIQRAMTSCKQSGNDPAYHFAGAGKLIEHGKGGKRDIQDFHLSRFACYLIAQNGDSRKPEIAHAQKYFAVQTRRQELSDAAARGLERIELREQTKHEFWGAVRRGTRRWHPQPHVRRVSRCRLQRSLRRVGYRRYQAAQRRPG